MLGNNQHLLNIPNQSKNLKKLLSKLKYLKNTLHDKIANARHYGQLIRFLKSKQY